MNLPNFSRLSRQDLEAFEGKTRQNDLHNERFLYIYRVYSHSSASFPTKIAYDHTEAEEFVDK